MGGLTYSYSNKGLWDQKKGGRCITSPLNIYISVIIS